MRKKHSNEKEAKKQLIEAKEKYAGKSEIQGIIMHKAAKIFITEGYEKATVRRIAAITNVNLGSVMYAYPTKELVMCDLVSYVLEGQFSFAEKLVSGKTDDKLLFYATETVLQLYMAESSEHVRGMYNVAYSLPKSSEIIYRTITEKLKVIFKDTLPDWQEQDFYEREIASAGVIRNYMSVPCNETFTMERKVDSFLKSTFALYDVPAEKVKEAKEFIKQFDFKSLAQSAIDGMLAYLEDAQEKDKTLKLRKKKKD